MAKIPEVALGSTQATIPVVGFGTAVYPLVASKTMKDSILQAIKLGYRHFDSAALYDSEQPLGEVVAEALRTELIKSRSELFITSKLWSSDAHHDHVLPALHKTLQNLGIEYLDLYLLHYPVSLEPGSYDFPFDKKRLVPMDFKAVWEAMEECQKLGLTRFIGVSNFSIQKLEKLLATANIPPAVNQVEMSPLWQQKNLREFCERKGIHITAYSPLGAKGTPWGTNGVMECEVLKQIAEAKGKTLAQVCLRWMYEQGVSVLVKSFNKERMQVNLDIFDWTLSPEESHMISQIKQHKGHPGFQFVSEEGPFKSVEELWDMEIDDHAV